VDDRRDVFQRALAWSAEGRRFALVTVVRTAGSTPRKAGARMLVRDDGSTHGTVGGGAVEQAFLQEALACLQERRPRLVRRHLTHDLAMCCGGEMEAFIEPFGLTETLVLVGAGHIHAALAPVGLALGFSVVAVDDLEELASPDRFPGARLVTSFDPRVWGVPFDEGAYIVVATRDHAVDQEVLEGLARLNARPAYLGVIGSQGKLLKFKKRLEHRGVDSAWIARIRGPIGVDVGAETPAEIAVAVAAELIAVRRRGQDTRVR
jgi:xanthine dehydrogenase accessory factor